MLNKIDNNLIRKIQIQSVNKSKYEVIVRSNNYYETYNYLKFNLGNDKILELPFVSSFVLLMSLDEIVKIAKLNDVEFVSSNAKVCSMIYQSSKFIGVENLLKKINKNYNHTCVVIDTGIYPHIDFVLGKNRILKFVDFINNSKNPYDDNGHGTFVSGIMCGNSLTNKYDGIDKYCNIIVIKALDNVGEANTATILQAMQWIINNRRKYNIKVVCMSFGSVVVDGVDPLIYGVEVLWDNGIVVVSAGGNNGPEKSTIMSPGASRKIITVGSLSKLGEGKFGVADFSSRGPINNSFKPDFVVPGVDIVSTDIFEKSKNFYTVMSGTSVSAPIVAGVASLLLRINPNYTPDQIKYMLIRSCVPIDGNRNCEGFGILNLNNIKLI